ncbi:MAG TPA: HlyD family efflux transporter periplasmic adaptor subunit [Pseudomonadales bacterium]
MKPTRSLWLIALASLLAGCAREGPLYAVGTLERDRIELAAESAEPVLEIPVEEGAKVTAGQVLLVQDPTRAEARLAQARAARDEAVAALAEAVAGPRAQQIAQAEARLAAARSAVLTTGHELRRERALRQQGFVSENRLDVLEGLHQEALARQREAEAALDELREGTRSEVVQRAREALAGAEARVRELEIALERHSVRAPMDGTVEALPVELGERPTPGQTVVVLRARGPTYARVHLPQPLRVHLNVGDPAEVRVDGRDAPLPGRIRWIASEAAFTPYFALTQRDRSRLAYLAEVLVEEAEALPVGIPVEARFPASPR